MIQTAVSQTVQMTVPADQSYTTVVSLALSGLGMMIGLDVDLLGDLRTVTAECLDCLLHQTGKPETIGMTADVNEGRLRVMFSANNRVCGGEEDLLDLDITRGVLETLMPEVALHVDDQGVHGIECSMPV